jgi:glycosyltransferase involved in cell wall biosynthesis
LSYFLSFFIGQSFRSNTRFRLNCLLARFADVIICNSSAGRDYYLARGYPAHKTHVVPNGIDTGRFQPKPHPRSDAPTFGLVGRLSPMKDHATFLKAATLVPDARFVIVGSGDENYAQEMRTLAAALGIADRVTWLPAQNDMPSVYAGFDCLVNASAFGEGFSNVIGEAMACGVPCIASDVGDSAAIIGDPSHIFPAGEHEALARRMLDFAKQSSPLALREELCALFLPVTPQPFEDCRCLRKPCARLAERGGYFHHPP